MSEPEPLNEVENQIRETLMSGGRVWLVGGALVPQMGRRPVLLKPAPDPEFKWSADAYSTAWSQRIGAFLQHHNSTAAIVLREEEHVNCYENVPLWLIEGWRE